MTFFSRCLLASLAYATFRGPSSFPVHRTRRFAPRTRGEYLAKLGGSRPYRNEWEGGSMNIVTILVIVLIVLAIAALAKYIFSR